MLSYSKPIQQAPSLRRKGTRLAAMLPDTGLLHSMDHTVSF